VAFDRYPIGSETDYADVQRHCVWAYRNESRGELLVQLTDQTIRAAGITVKRPVRFFRSHLT